MFADLSGCYLRDVCVHKNGLVSVKKDTGFEFVTRMLWSLVEGRVGFTSNIRQLRPFFFCVHLSCV